MLLKSQINTITKTSILLVPILFSIILAQPRKIAIVPFTVFSDSTDTSTTPLESGIYDLLSSRLSRTDENDTILIINREETEKAWDAAQNFTGETRALMVGAALKSNFVVFGSLTKVDSTFSLHTQIVDVSGKKPTQTFNTNLDSIDKALPTANGFATEINEQFLSGTEEIQAVPDSLDTLPKDTSQAFSDDTVPEADTAAVEKPVDSALVKAEGTADSTREFWKSQIHPILINGLAVGDVDNDSSNEIIIVTPKMLQMYKCKEKKLVKVKDIQKIRFKYPIGVDIADINGNGFSEIFIIALDTYQKRASTMVIEFDGTNYNTIVKSTPWYLRVVKIKDNPPLLLGQRHAKNSPFRGDIHEMKWDKEKYVPHKKIHSSKNLHVNVLGLGYGDLLNNKKPTVVSYDKRNAIKIISNSGDVIGESEKALGGSNFFYILDGLSTEEEHIYLPMRLVLSDVDSDSICEIFAVKNYDVTRNIFGKFRHFNKCHIETMQWDGISLNTTWKTGTISGFIRDFVIADFDNDGQDEFIAGLVHKEGKFLFVKPKCSIITYELK